MDLHYAAILSLTWCAYFIVHSILASLRIKQYVSKHCANCMAVYRIVFNALAIIFLFIPLFMLFVWRSELLWQWQGVMLWVMNAIALAAIVLFTLTLKYYDLGEFLGLRQWRDQEKSVEDQENFHLSPLHRFVRHPWYFLSIVVIWTRSMDLMFLVSAIAITVYFIVGSRLEERKLVAYHGDIYRRYKQRVPGVFPLPWKFLRAGEEL